MNYGLQILKGLARISQSRKSSGLLLALPTPEFMLCNSPFRRSPKDRFCACQDANCDRRNRSVRFTHSLLLRPDLAARRPGSSAVRLHRRPERDGSLQTGVSVKRHRSSYFPCSPSVTRSVLIPRPAARRVSASASHPSRSKSGPAGDPIRRPTGYGFQKIFYAKNKNAKRFSEPSVKASLGTWERGTSRRFAQECPEGNPGKYKQGETQWHSTKTKSL